MTLRYPTGDMILGSEVKVTGSQSAKRRSSGRRELCSLSSAQRLVDEITAHDDV